MSAAPRFQASTVARASDNTGTQSVPWPDHIENDVALLLVETDNNPVTLSVANGFVLLGQHGINVAGAANATMMQVFWNRASSGSMVAPTIAAPVNHQINRMLTFRGCITTGNPYEAVTNDDHAANTTAVSVLCPTTLGTNRLVLNCIAVPTDTALDQFSAPANAALTSVGMLTDTFVSKGNGGGFGVIDGIKAATGAVGNSTATLGTTNAYASVSFALKGPTDIVSTPPTWQGDGGFTQAAGARTPSWPAGHQLNDIGVMFVETCAQNVATVPTGWAHAPNSPVSIGTAGASDATMLSVLWKRVTTVPEPNLSIGDSGDHQGACIAIVRGCVATGNPWDVTNFDTLGVAGTAITVPGVTTTQDNCLIIHAMAHGLDLTGGQVSGWANAGLTSVAEVLDHSDTGGNGGGYSAMTGVKAVHGATGNGTATLSNNSKQAHWTGALIPVAGASTPAPDPQSDVNAPHQFWRLKLTNTPGAGPDFTEAEVVVREGAVAAVGSLITQPSKMHPGTTHIRPLLVTNRANTDGIFDIDFMLITVPAGYSPDKFADEVRKRNDSIYNSDGTLKDGVVQYDGATGLPLVKGIQRGSGRHHDPIIFSPPYQSVPKVDVTGGLPTQPESKWGTAAQVDAGSGATSAPTGSIAQLPDYGALDLTPAGFTIRARLRQSPGGESLRTDSFTPTHLVNAGDLLAVTLANAPAADDQYFFNAQWQSQIYSTTGNLFTVSALVDIQSNDGSGWVTRLQVLVSMETNSTSLVTVGDASTYILHVAGLDPTDQIRAKINRRTTSGLGVISDFSFDPISVLYYTSSDTYASKTPANYNTALAYWESSGYL
jgi:hypothetical protein